MTTAPKCSASRAHRIPMPVHELSVFFPAFDEEANIERTVERALDALRRLPLERFEVLVIDDGSTDATPKIADALAEHEPEVRVVHHSENRGYGAALRTGFESSRCEWIFFTDGDGQFDVDELPLLLARADTAHPIGLNVLEKVPADDRHRVTEELCAYFEAMWPNGWA